MIVDMRGQSPEARYHWMTQAVIPRPIAWILTANDDGGFNLAPFSYFNALCSAPPLVGVSISRKPDGAPKDTLRNIRARKTFVVHIAAGAQLSQLNESAATLPYGESESARLNLRTVSFGDSARLADAPLALLCNFYREIALDDSDEQKLVLGEIELLYAADSVLSEDEKGRTKIAAQKVNPPARLSAGNYALLGEFLSLRRPA